MNKKLMKQLYRFVDRFRKNTCEHRLCEAIQRGGISSNIQSIQDRIKYLNTMRLLTRYGKNWYSLKNQAFLEVLSEKINRVTQQVIRERECHNKMNKSITEEVLDLYNLIEEGFLWYNAKTDLLIKTTAFITLEDVDLGRFDITLDKVGRLRAVALDPNPCVSNESITHPHVSQEQICLGDAVAAVKAAVERLDFYSVFEMANSVLENYNPFGPYIALEEWETPGSYCYECGDNTGELYYCAKCDEHYCEDCCNGCAVCEEIHCYNHMTQCSYCQDYVCSNCVGAHCTVTDLPICENCITDMAQCEHCEEYMLPKYATACDECGCCLCPQCACSCDYCGNTLCKDCICSCEEEESLTETTQTT